MSTATTLTTNTVGTHDVVVACESHHFQRIANMRIDPFDNQFAASALTLTNQLLEFDAEDDDISA